MGDWRWVLYSGIAWVGWIVQERQVPCECLWYLPSAFCWVCLRVYVCVV